MNFNLKNREQNDIISEDVFFEQFKISIDLIFFFFDFYSRCNDVVGCLNDDEYFSICKHILICSKSENCYKYGAT